MVLAVGNPLGLSGSVTEGIISATGRAVTEPAAAPRARPRRRCRARSRPARLINPGNSGGALVNASAQVIGIPTLAAASPQGGGQAQGIGFAIPSNLARDIARQIITTGHVTNSHRAALGAQTATVTGPDGAPRGTGIVAVTERGSGRPGRAAARRRDHVGRARADARTRRRCPRRWPPHRPRRHRSR